MDARHRLRRMPGTRPRTADAWRQTADGGWPGRPPLDCLVVDGCETKRHGRELRRLRADVAARRACRGLPAGAPPRQRVPAVCRRGAGAGVAARGRSEPTAPASARAARARQAVAHVSPRGRCCSRARASGRRGPVSGRRPRHRRPRGRRRVQPQPLPAHRVGHRQEPGRATGEHRRAGRHPPRRDRDRGLGDSRGTSTASMPRRPASSSSRGAATTSESSMGAGRAGTAVSSAMAASP